MRKEIIGDATLYLGDCIEVLRTLPDQSVHCCVTSPPYYGLRDYGTGVWEGGDTSCLHEPRSGLQGKCGQRATRTFTAEKPQGQTCSRCGAVRVDKQIGLEDTPDEYIDKMVEVFREVWRVLRDDGTLWLNLGSSFCSRSIESGRYVVRRDLTNEERNALPAMPQEHKAQGVGTRGNISIHRDSSGYGLEDITFSKSVIPTNFLAWCEPEYTFKSKDLINIPSMVAEALRRDGWYLRQDLIWQKPAPMPESVADRCTKSHEYIFLLTKQPRYYFDADAIKEPVSGTAHHRGSGVHPKSAEPGSGIKQNSSFSAAVRGLVSTRNKRSVWTVATQPYSGAHFAVFPAKLIEPCILAGTSEHGCCAECGAPWQRAFVRRQSEKTRASMGSCPDRGDGGHRERDPSGDGGNIYATRRIGTDQWAPGCECGVDSPTVPCTVLDPFGGAGTTAMVALEHGLQAILCELNPEYLAMACERIKQAQRQMRMFA